MGTVSVLLDGSEIPWPNERIKVKIVPVLKELVGKNTPDWGWVNKNGQIQRTLKDIQEGCGFR